MKIIFLIISILINYIPFTSALTFKSDGTVIKSDGTYLKEPPFLQYQRALNSYLNGDPLPEDWPVVELDSSGNPKKVKGYFGEKILEEGAPLFSVPKNLDADIIESLALQNGLLKDQLGAVLVSNSKSEWRQESEIEKEISDQSKQYSTSLAKSGFMDFKLKDITKDFINYENLKTESKLFLIMNPNDKIAVIDYRRELDSKVADISNKLKIYFQFGDVESKNLLKELSSRFRELTKDYDKKEITDSLQLELKNLIKLNSNTYIDNLNYSLAKENQTTELNNQFSKMLKNQIPIEEFKKQLEKQIQNEIEAIEQELIINQNDESLDCNNNSPSDVDDYGDGC